MVIHTNIYLYTYMHILMLKKDLEKAHNQNNRWENNCSFSSRYAPDVTLEEMREARNTPVLCLTNSGYTAGGVGQFPLPPFPITPQCFFLFSCVCCDLTDWKERFYDTQRKSQIWKGGLEEKAFFPLTVNKSLHIAIYANKQSIRKAIHLEVLWERGQIKLSSVTLLHPSTSTTKKWLANWNVSFYCFVYLGPFKSTMKIFFMIRPTHEMVKSTLTFTKCYNQWCNLCK